MVTDLKFAGWSYKSTIGLKVLLTVYQLLSHEYNSDVFAELFCELFQNRAGF